MRLARLALEGVLFVLVLVGGVVVVLFAMRRDVLLDVFLGALERGLVRGGEDAEAEFDVANQVVGAAAGKVLAADDAQHLEAVGLGGHCVGGDDPAAGAEVGGEGKLVVGAVGNGVLFGAVGEAKGDEGQAVAGRLGHDDEAEVPEAGGEVVGGADEVAHDGAVAVLAEADELVVLADDLGGALGEVEGEGGLLGAEVVDVEDEVLGEVLAGAPDGPADAGVDEAVLNRDMVSKSCR